ncbi:uncharacterized protein LOC107268326 isoform X2 [Cephus cinctus]|uniref:Uncharacterized protein LOC107268326 isoform X2 n=1 Tax=Cephus cinctus TaxID=211228 RepID=A0AAJ7BY73_CEPCN|nr:uncharacterized protein LOC107268326 isoform X2 [Cephus cinctus]
MSKNGYHQQTPTSLYNNEQSLRGRVEVTMVQRNATDDKKDTRGSNRFRLTKEKVVLLVGQAKLKSKSSVPSNVSMVRNGRQHVRRGVRARCASRVSNCRSVKKTFRRAYTLSINLFGYRNSYTTRRSFINQKSAEQFFQLQHRRFKNISNRINSETVTQSSSTLLLPSETKLFRKRRVGIVENQYENEQCPIFSPIRDLIHRFTELLSERNTWHEHEASNGFKMKSKNLVNRDRMLDDTCDLAEAKEQVEFNVAKMAVARSYSKSSQSDEGIEPDTIPRNNSFRRCWSLDSAAPSEEDILRNADQQMEHKLQVSRCCSSDSAVLSDEDHNKGWENSNLGENGDYEFTEGQPRFWRTPSVVVSDYSDYSYLDEKFERSNLDIDKFTDKSRTPSQASSCSCLDCDEFKEFNDILLLQDSKLPQICRHRRHSDSCYLCISSTNSASERLLLEVYKRTIIKHDMLAVPEMLTWMETDGIPAWHLQVLTPRSGIH